MSDLPVWLNGGRRSGGAGPSIAQPDISELDLDDGTACFREELRQWIDEVVPADRDERKTMIRSGRWEELLLAQHLICANWPTEFGGRDLSGLQSAVLSDEFRRARVPRIKRGMGELLVGPSLIVHGTEAQQQHFLPRIIDGTDRYCQGFSEPDAGSDLAALTTRGVVDGDEIVITGQKVWTSFHEQANMIFVLCRTDPEAPKHRGISYVLVPIDRPDGEPNGIEFRPIRQITGDAHFAETWLDGAHAPMDHVVGGLNTGWRVSMTTLGNERGSGAATRHIEHEKMFWALVDESRQRARNQQPMVRDELARFYTSVAIMRFEGLRQLSALADDRDPGPGSSLGKMLWTEHQQRLTEFAMDVLGADGMLDRSAHESTWWVDAMLGSRAHTIWGGTAEVQRNIIAERVLGLPKDPGSNTTEAD